MMENQTTGFIHSFESFGASDGPGLRSVVFLQGCRFRCLYCHNPDTWYENTGDTLSTDVLVDKILRFRPYFDTSGGGATVSGGEPLLQIQFVTELFRKLKQKGIHTCLDTSGNIPPEMEDEKVMELLCYTDLVLLDIKHAEPEKHRIITGSENIEALRFIRLLKQSGTPVWLRYVIIPGYTDDPEDIKAFKSLANTIPNVQKTEYLPFHKAGEYKWRELGLAYRLSSVVPPSEQFMNSIRNP